jgi:hypothetical protein
MSVFQETFFTGQGNNTTLAGPIAGITPTAFDRILSLPTGPSATHSITGNPATQYNIQGSNVGSNTIKGQITYRFGPGVLSGLGSNLAFEIRTQTVLNLATATCEMTVIQGGVPKFSQVVDILAVATHIVSPGIMSPAVTAGDITQVTADFTFTTTNTGGTSRLTINGPIQSTVNCVPGFVRVLTPAGLRRADALTRGDLVSTRDYATRTVAFRPVARIASTPVRDAPVVRLASCAAGPSAASASASDLDVVLTRPHPVEVEGRHVEAGWLERNGRASAERFTGTVFSLHFDEEVAFAAGGAGTFIHAQSPALHSCALRADEFSDAGKFVEGARTNFIRHEHDLPWVLEDGTVMRWAEGGVWTPQGDA